MIVIVYAVVERLGGCLSRLSVCAESHRETKQKGDEGGGESRQVQDQVQDQAQEVDFPFARSLMWS